MAIIVKSHSKSCFFKQISYEQFLTPKKIHCVFLVCQIMMILLGTTLIGLSTSLYKQQFSYCDHQNDIFCSYDFTLTQPKELFIYLVVQNFYQNNRMFLDGYSPIQLQGNIHNKYHCQGYHTYSQLGFSQNAGGYRVPPSTNAFPCGEAMTNIFNDTLFLISSSGGALNLQNQDLTSEFSSKYKFINLPNFQLAQWIDMESLTFTNFFTIPYTSKKYSLMANVALSADTYQLLLRNNYPTNDALLKKVLIAETNALGTKDPLQGFLLFVSGMLLLLFHILLCCKGLK